MQRRFILKTLLAVFAAAAVASAPASRAAGQEVRLGTMSGQDAQIWAVAKKVAEGQGLKIKIIEFSDYLQPNAALDAGDLDANAFQHQPYLDSQVRQRGYRIVSVGFTYISPMGVYSNKLKSLQDLPQRARVGIPNDPSNENRALLLLQAKGVIRLKAGAGVAGTNATVFDVVDNPKHIKLLELDAAQLPRALGDLDAAAINTNFALEAGLDPRRGAIALEDKQSPYANIIVVRARDKDKPWVRQLVAAYQSPQVRDFIQAQFKGAVLPAF